VKYYRVFVAIRAHRHPRTALEKYFLPSQILAEFHENLMNRWFFIVQGDPLEPFSPDDEIWSAVGDRVGYAQELLDSQTRIRQKINSDVKKKRETTFHEC